MSEPAVAVAVVSWNTRDLLETCLHSLRHDFEAGRAEVWVVDNASSDGSPDMVEADFPWVRLVRSRENLGFGRAVNLVAGRTAAPWIAAANSDIRLEPGALPALLEAGARDPEAAIVAPMLVLPDESIQPSVQPFPTLTNTALLRLRAYRLSPRIGRRLCLRAYRDPAQVGHVDWAAGAFLLIRRGPFDDLGGFDREQWLYAEDLDLAWRISRAGWKVLYEPSAVVRHEESAATRTVWGDALTAKWHAATYAWVARRRGLASARALAGLNMGMTIAEWLAYSVVARLTRSALWKAKESRARSGMALHALGLRPREELLSNR
jgi:N-acetylglucosaminyl-diphospho-decaprenol L-rhamnosyltransferase